MPIKDRPPFEWSPAHLALAKRRLERFSLVMPTERLGDAGPLLADKFGWGATDAAALRSGTHKTAGAAAAYQNKTAERLWSDAVLADEVERNNRLDNELYAHAVELFELELKALRSAQAAATRRSRRSKGL